MILEYMLQGFQIIFSLSGFITLTLSVFVGLIFGILPGLTATMAMALLVGLTYSFEGTLAVLCLVGIYVGSISGGSQAAILLNIPGTPASAATVVEGHPLAQKGQAGLAIFSANAGSFFGTIGSMLCVLLLTPILAQAALRFNAQEMFLLCVFGVAICGNITSAGKPVKGWIAGFLGLMFSQVGIDTVTAMTRFSFGNVNLTAGISLLPVMIGLFGFPEIVAAFTPEKRKIIPLSKFSLGEGFGVIMRNKINLLRSSLMGVAMGVIPGVGEDTGGWLSYWSCKRFTKGGGWGQGRIEGVIASEAGSNAAKGGAFIPVLTLAIPGSAPAAVLLAALWMHGFRPGPLMMQDTPEFLYYIAVFLTCAAIMMWIQASVISRYTVRILQVRGEILMPIIFICCVVGAFVISGRMFDVMLMFAFGILGLVMKYMQYPFAPFLLGIILGNMADENLRRALILNDGSFASFFYRPISLFFVIFILILVLPQIPVINKVIEKVGAAIRAKVSGS